MTTWTQLGTFELKDSSINAPWVQALADLQIVADPAVEFTHLRISAEGQWEVLSGLKLNCGPDGHAGIPADAATLPVGSALPGALIGKIGGSSASIEVAKAGADPGTAALPQFAVGSICVVALAGQPKGPLFLGMNIRSRPLAVESLRVNIEAAKIV